MQLAGVKNTSEESGWTEFVLSLRKVLVISELLLSSVLTANEASGRYLPTYLPTHIPTYLHVFIYTRIGEAD